MNKVVILISMLVIKKSGVIFTQMLKKNKVFKK